MKKFFIFAVALACGGLGYFVFPGAVPTQRQAVEDTAAVAKAPPGTFVFTYKIRGGDSLALIAQRFGISLKTLRDANIVKDDIIYKGDILAVPLDSSRIIRFHTVAGGETLFSVAQLYGTSVDSIKKLNRIRSDTIFASQKILVHGSGGPVSRFAVFSVAKGDTLREISQAFGVSVKDIERLNVSTPNWAEPGSQIIVDTFVYRYERQIQENIIKTAFSYLGAPYRYGGNSVETGIDCSAYVKKVFSFFGVKLPRTVRMMHRHAKGRWIEKNGLEKGDLVFFETDRPFPSHIGIYTDNGNFIHASSVQGKVVVSNLSEHYYTKTYIGAKRVYIGSQKAVASSND